jgi:2-polyprenyl-3-methyl-5-hydroxy-6-metoxy-1,4-benzoquinol methylase
MEYEPIKRSLGNIFNKSPFLRKLFYKLLDLLLLRCWHVHKELRIWRSRLGIMNSGLAIGELNILDAGSGFGQYSYWLAKKFPKANILAVDVKEEQIADCNRFFAETRIINVRFEVADLTTFVQQDKYNLVLSVDVMEHIREDVQVFKNIYASLKKGGMLLISTPSDQGGSDVHKKNEKSFIGEHVRNGYSIKEIEEKLRRVGFSKVEAKYAYGTPGKISWRLSMKYPMKMLNVTKLFFILLPFYDILTYPFAFILNYLDTYCSHKTGTGLIVKAWK